MGGFYELVLFLDMADVFVLGFGLCAYFLTRPCLWCSGWRYRLGRCRDRVVLCK